MSIDTLVQKCILISTLVALSLWHKSFLKHHTVTSYHDDELMKWLIKGSKQLLPAIPVSNTFNKVPLN